MLNLVSVKESQRYETYVYDAGGNVTTETAYTDNTKTKKIYEVSYTYNNPTDAVLQSSQKKVYDTDGTTLLQTASKTYEYNGVGDITGVNTTIV
jgi:YD repeat-containing protein